MELLKILRIILPISLIGSGVVYLINFLNKKSTDNGEDNNDNIILFMSLGMTFGTAFAILFDFKNIGIGASTGMFIGMIIGMNIKSKI